MLHRYLQRNGDIWISYRDKQSIFCILETVSVSCKKSANENTMGRTKGQGVILGFWLGTNVLEKRNVWE